MLIYDQSQDPYHCAVRSIGIASLLRTPQLDIAKLGILDLVANFPQLLHQFRLPKDLLELRKLEIAKPNPYRPSPSTHAAIQAIRSIQGVALATLASSGLIHKEGLRRGKFELTGMSFPEPIQAAVSSWTQRDAEEKRQIIQALDALPLSGPDGLKHRSGLMEHRYDAV